MATITLEYDAHNALAASIVNTMKASGVFKIATSASKKSERGIPTGIEDAIQDIRNGQINQYANSTELFQKLGI